MSAAFSAASASAPGERSIALTLAPGSRAASASAIAPVPVPTSTMLGAAMPGQQREAAIDEHLRLGTRHERAGVAVQLQPVEAPAPEHVGERLALAAPAHELAQAVDLGRLERAIVVEVQLEPRHREDVGQQILGVELRRGHALLLQVLARAPEQLADGAHLRLAASSRRLRSSSSRACVKAERSPARTASRLCDVSLMRWSVTRRSG